jgi:DNA-binding HxlR family transcriptional regulator
VRTGAFALSLLSAPINMHALSALEQGPRTLVDLRRLAGSPPPTTLRGHLRRLTEIGVVERRGANHPQTSVEFALAESGRELLGAAATLQAWLAESPEGPLELGNANAKGAVKALAEGWSTGMIRALASKPLTLTELDRLITDVSYPSLERRLEAMRMVGQIEPVPSRGRGTPYTVTDWLRKAIAPIIAAVHWEQMQLPSRAPAITKIDVEAAFMMVIPMLGLGEELSGTSRLAVEMNDGDGKPRLAGVMVALERARVASCTTRMQGEPNAEAIGSATSWIRAVTDPEPERLKISGDRRMAVAFVTAIHEALFGAAREV